MSLFQIPGTPPDMHRGVSPSEKRRLIALSIAFALVLAVLTAVWMKSGPSDDPDMSDLPAFGDELPIETVDLPELDPGQFEPLVQDERGEDRVLLESEAVEAALAIVRTLTPRHYEAMEARELSADIAASLIENPGAQRAQPFTVRGRIETIRTRRRSLTATEEHVGRIRLEDDGVAYFLTLDMPELVSDFVRIDGLFLKAYSEENEEASGEWIEGPLIVGAEGIRSFPSMGEVTVLDARWINSVELHDEILLNPDGTVNRDIETGLPFAPLWHAMAYVRDLPEGAIDWEKAPLLDKATVSAIMHDGATHRLQPFRFPMSRLQHATVKRAGENPARIEFYTEGWLGNIQWNNVIHFQAPFEDRNARLTNYATARGFFLKNYAYPSNTEGIRVAPAFILHSLDIHEVAPDPLFAAIAYSLAGLTAICALFFVVLLVRDRKKSAALQEKLLRRRRARRDGSSNDNSVGATST